MSYSKPTWHSQPQEMLVPNNDAEKDRSTSLSSDDIVHVIFESFGDEQKRAIINAVANEPLTFIEIVKTQNLPLASCARKIKSLMQQGLVACDKSNSIRGRKYRLTFEGMKIELWKDKVTVDIISNKKLPPMLSCA